MATLYEKLLVLVTINEINYKIHFEDREILQQTSELAKYEDFKKVILFSVSSASDKFYTITLDKFNQEITISECENMKKFYEYISDQFDSNFNPLFV